MCDGIFPKNSAVEETYTDKTQSEHTTFAVRYLKGQDNFCSYLFCVVKAKYCNSLIFKDK